MGEESAMISINGHTLRLAAKFLGQLIILALKVSF